LRPMPVRCIVTSPLSDVEEDVDVATAFPRQPSK